jgi:shikimate kinase
MGLLISKKLNLNFFDIDNIIEKELNSKISDIFKKKVKVFLENLKKKQL